MSDETAVLLSAARALRWGGAFSIALAVLLLVGTILAQSWGLWVIMGRYAELYNLGVGVVSGDDLRTFRDGEYAGGQWSLLEDFLLKDVIEVLSVPPFVTAALLAAHGMFLIIRSIRIGHVARKILLMNKCERECVDPV